MDKEFGALDYWRKYFRSAKTEIFEVIEYAIIVAASDCPKEFRIKRDQIAETLFSCRFTRCLGRDHVELEIANDEEDGGGVSKESNANSSTDDHVNLNRVSNYNYDEAEALTDEIEEEILIVEEVLRIKGVLANNQDESDQILFESLRRLQLMALSVEALKVTEIGKAVNGLRKHESKDIRHLARTLINGWKDMVDEWVGATAEITEGTPNSVNPSVVDEEEGLPSPPLDEGAFFATQTTSMELSKFFDGMDDDGNPRNGGESNKNPDKGRKPLLENHNIPKLKQQPSHDANVLTNKESRLMKKQEAIIKQRKPSDVDLAPWRPLKASSDQRVNNETKFQQKLGNRTIQKKPLVGYRDKSKCADEVERKLEASKRKLQEGYQQAENAKKQRTIQVMELHDLPKQGFGHRNPHFKTGNQNRRWNGRN